ncbi:hypothetical protein ACFL3J_01315, partial [Candidatus Omnitrophota bacterium]
TVVTSVVYDGVTYTSTDVVENTYVGDDKIRGHVTTSNAHTVDMGGLEKTTEMTFANYDRFGNAGNRTIVTTIIEDGVDYVFSDTITNTYEGVDKIRGNATTSHIVSVDPVGDERINDITYSNYDVFGNAWDQTIVTTFEENGTAYQTTDVISSTYVGVDKIRGNITTSHIVSTDASGDDTTMDIAYSNYDAFGNAWNQVSETYYEESATEPQETMTISNTYLGIDRIRGNATTSDVITADEHGVYGRRQYIAYDDYDSFGNAWSRTINNYAYNTESGEFEWGSETVESIVYRFDGVAKYYESISYTAIDYYDTVYTERPDDANLVESHKTVTDMREETYAGEGLTQEFDMWDNVRYVTVDSFDWIIVEGGENYWQHMSTTVRENNLDTVDSKGRITQYSEVTTVDASNFVTETAVDILQFDFKGRQEIVEKTTHIYGSMIDDGGELVEIENTIWILLEVTEFDACGRQKAYEQQSRNANDGAEMVGGEIVDGTGVLTTSVVSDVTYYANDNMKGSRELLTTSDLPELETTIIKSDATYTYLDQVVSDTTQTHQFAEGIIDITTNVQRYDMEYNALGELTRYFSRFWSDASPDSVITTETYAIVYDDLDRVLHSESSETEGNVAGTAITQIEELFEDFDSLSDSEKQATIEAIGETVGLEADEITASSSLVQQGIENVINWLKDAGTFVINCAAGALSYLLAAFGAGTAKYDILAQVILVDLLTGGIDLSSPSGLLETSMFSVLRVAAVNGVILSGQTVSLGSLESVVSANNPVIAIIESGGESHYVAITSVTASNVTYVDEHDTVTVSRSTFNSQYTGKILTTEEDLGTLLTDNQMRATRAAKSALQEMDPFDYRVTHTVKSDIQYNDPDPNLATSWHETTTHDGAPDKITNSDVEVSYNADGDMATYYAFTREMSVSDNGASLDRSYHFYKEITEIDQITGNMLQWTQRTYADTANPDLATVYSVTATYDTAGHMTTYSEDGYNLNVVLDIADPVAVEAFKTKDVADMDGSILYEHYTFAKTDLEYDTFGRASSWHEVTTSSNTPDQETRKDVTRTYDPSGDAAVTTEEVTEIDINDPGILNRTYTLITETTDYNDLGQAVRAVRTTIDDGKTTVETDTVDKTYDSQGHLETSNIEVHETGGNLNNTYSVATAITSYNDLGQVLRMTKSTTEDDLVTIEADSTASVRQYDIRGNLLYTDITYTEIDRTDSSNLNHTYTVETTIDSDDYNDLGQVLKMTKVMVDLGKTTTTTDIAPRQYNDQGRLTYSKTRVHETGSNYDNTYTEEATITSYNNLGQVLRMTKVTVDGSITTTETDVSNRQYNSDGRLKYSRVQYNERGGNLNYTYTTAITVSSYNSLGQVSKMTKQTVDSGKTTTETDLSPRQYDRYGRLTYSKTQVNEQGGGYLNHTYTVTTSITSYNSLGQVLRMTKTTSDNGKITTETDVANRQYDNQGRTTYSRTQVNESGNGVNHTYTTATTISSYNSLNQITDKTTTVSDNQRVTTTRTNNINYNSLGQMIGRTDTNTSNYDNVTIVDVYSGITYDSCGSMKTWTINTTKSNGSQTVTMPTTTRLATSYNANGDVSYYKESRTARVDGQWVSTTTEWKNASYSGRWLTGYTTVNTETSGQTSTSRVSNIQYNSRGQIASETRRTWSQNDDGENVYSISYVSYGYDGYGRRTQEWSHGTSDGDSTSSYTVTTYYANGTSYAVARGRTDGYNNLTRTTTYLDGSKSVQGYFDGESGNGGAYSGWPGYYTETYDIMGTKRTHSSWFDYYYYQEQTTVWYTNVWIEEIGHWERESDGCGGHDDVWVVDEAAHYESVRHEQTDWVRKTATSCSSKSWTANGGVASEREWEENVNIQRGSSISSDWSNVANAIDRGYGLDGGHSSMDTVDFIEYIQDLNAQNINPVVKINGIDITADIASFDPINNPTGAARLVVDLSCILLLSRRATDEEFASWTAGHEGEFGSIDGLHNLTTHVHDTLESLINNDVTYQTLYQLTSLHGEFGLDAEITLVLYDEKQDGQWQRQSLDVDGGVKEIEGTDGTTYEEHYTIHEKYTKDGLCYDRNNRTEQWRDGAMVEWSESVISDAVLEVIDGEERLVSWTESSRHGGSWFDATEWETSTHTRTYNLKPNGEIESIDEIVNSEGWDTEGGSFTRYENWHITDWNIFAGDGVVNCYSMSGWERDEDGIHYLSDSRNGEVNDNGQLTSYTQTTSDTHYLWDGSVTNERDTFVVTGITYNDAGQVTFSSTTHTYLGLGGIELTETYDVTRTYNDDGRLTNITTVSTKPGSAQHITAELQSLYDSNTELGAWLRSHFGADGAALTTDEDNQWYNMTLVDWAQRQLSDIQNASADDLYCQSQLQAMYGDDLASTDVFSPYTQYGSDVQTTTTRNIISWTISGNAYEYYERTTDNSSGGVVWSESYYTGTFYNINGNVLRQLGTSRSTDASGTMGDYNGWEWDRYTYNGMGQVTYMTRGDDDDSDYSRTWYTYDEYGNVLETEVIVGATDNGWFADFCDFMTGGLIDSEGWSHKEQYTYDANGVMTDQESIDGYLETDLMVVVKIIVDIVVAIVCAVLCVVAGLGALIYALYMAVTEAMKQQLTYGEINWESVGLTFLISFCTFYLTSFLPGSQAGIAELANTAAREGIGAVIKQIFQQAVQSVINFATAVWTAITTAWNTLVNLATTLVTQGFTAFLQAAGQALSKLGSWIWGGITGTSGAAAGATYGSKFIGTYLTSGVSQIVQHFWGQDIYDAFRDMGANDEWATFFSAASTSMITSLGTNGNLFGHNAAQFGGAAWTGTGLLSRIGRTISLNLSGILPISNGIINTLTSALQSTVWHEIKVNNNVLKWNEEKGEWVAGDQEGWAYWITGVLPSVGGWADNLSEILNPSPTQVQSTQNGSGASLTVKDKDGNVRGLNGPELIALGVQPTTDLDLDDPIQKETFINNIKSKLNLGDNQALGIRIVGSDGKVESVTFSRGGADGSLARSSFDLQWVQGNLGKRNETSSFGATYGNIAADQTGMTSGEINNIDTASFEQQCNVAAAIAGVVQLEQNFTALGKIIDGTTSITRSERTSLKTQLGNAQNAVANAIQANDYSSVEGAVGDLSAALQAAGLVPADISAAISTPKGALNTKAITAKSLAPDRDSTTDLSDATPSRMETGSLRTDMGDADRQISSTDSMADAPDAQTTPDIPVAETSQIDVPEAERAEQPAGALDTDALRDTQVLPGISTQAQREAETPQVQGDATVPGSPTDPLADRGAVSTLADLVRKQELTPTTATQGAVDSSIAAGEQAAGIDPTDSGKIQGALLGDQTIEAVTPDTSTLDTGDASEVSADMAASQRADASTSVDKLRNLASMAQTAGAQIDTGSEDIRAATGQGEQQFADTGRTMSGGAQSVAGSELDSTMQSAAVSDQAASTDIGGVPESAKQVQAAGAGAGVEDAGRAADADSRASVPSAASDRVDAEALRSPAVGGTDIAGTISGTAGATGVADTESRQDTGLSSSMAGGLSGTQGLESTLGAFAQTEPDAPTQEATTQLRNDVEQVTAEAVDVARQEAAAANGVAPGSANSLALNAASEKIESAASALTQGDAKTAQRALDEGNNILANSNVENIAVTSAIQQLQGAINAIDAAPVAQEALRSQEGRGAIDRTTEGVTGGGVDAPKIDTVASARDAFMKGEEGHFNEVSGPGAVDEGEVTVEQAAQVAQQNFDTAAADAGTQVKGADSQVAENLRNTQSSLENAMQSQSPQQMQEAAGDAQESADKMRADGLNDLANSVEQMIQEAGNVQNAQRQQAMQEAQQNFEQATTDANTSMDREADAAQNLGAEEQSEFSDRLRNTQSSLENAMQSQSPQEMQEATNAAQDLAKDMRNNELNKTADSVDQMAEEAGNVAENQRQQAAADGQPGTSDMPGTQPGGAQPGGDAGQPGDADTQARPDGTTTEDAQPTAQPEAPGAQDEITPEAQPVTQDAAKDVDRPTALDRAQSDVSHLLAEVMRKDLMDKIEAGELKFDITVQGKTQTVTVAKLVGTYGQGDEARFVLALVEGQYIEAGSQKLMVGNQSATYDLKGNMLAMDSQGNVQLLAQANTSDWVTLPQGEGGGINLAGFVDLSGTHSQLRVTADDKNVVSGNLAAVINLDTNKDGGLTLSNNAQTTVSVFGKNYNVTFTINGKQITVSSNSLQSATFGSDTYDITRIAISHTGLTDKEATALKQVLAERFSIQETVAIQGGNYAGNLSNLAQYIIGQTAIPANERIQFADENGASVGNAVKTSDGKLVGEMRLALTSQQASDLVGIEVSNIVKANSTITVSFGFEGSSDSFNVKPITAFGANGALSAEVLNAAKQDEGGEFVIAFIGKTASFVKVYGESNTGVLVDVRDGAARMIQGIGIVTSNKSISLDGAAAISVTQEEISIDQSRIFDGFKGSMQERLNLVQDLAKAGIQEAVALYDKNNALIGVIDAFSASNQEAINVLRTVDSGMYLLRNVDTGTITGVAIDISETAIAGVGGAIDLKGVDATRWQAFKRDIDGMQSKLSAGEFKALQEYLTENNAIGSINYAFDSNSKRIGHVYTDSSNSPLFFVDASGNVTTLKDYAHESRVVVKAGTVLNIKSINEQRILDKAVTLTEDGKEVACILITGSELLLHAEFSDEALHDMMKDTSPEKTQAEREAFIEFYRSFSSSLDEAHAKDAGRQAAIGQLESDLAAFDLIGKHAFAFNSNMELVALGAFDENGKLTGFITTAQLTAAADGVSGTRFRLYSMEGGLIKTVDDTDSYVEVRDANNNIQVRYDKASNQVIMQKSPFLGKTNQEIASQIGYTGDLNNQESFLAAMQEYIQKNASIVYDVNGKLMEGIIVDSNGAVSIVENGKQYSAAEYAQMLIAKAQEAMSTAAKEGASPTEEPATAEGAVKYNLDEFLSLTGEKFESVREKEKALDVFIKNNPDFVKQLKDLNSFLEGQPELRRAIDLLSEYAPHQQKLSELVKVSARDSNGDIKTVGDVLTLIGKAEAISGSQNIFGFYEGGTDSGKFNRLIAIDVVLKSIGNPTLLSSISGLSPLLTERNAILASDAISQYNGYQGQLAELIGTMGEDGYEGGILSSGYNAYVNYIIDNPEIAGMQQEITRLLGGADENGEWEGGEISDLYNQYLGKVEALKATGLYDQYLQLKAALQDDPLYAEYSQLKEKYQTAITEGRLKVYRENGKVAALLTPVEKGAFGDAELEKGVYKDQKGNLYIELATGQIVKIKKEIANIQRVTGLVASRAEIAERIDALRDEIKQIDKNVKSRQKEVLNTLAKSLDISRWKKGEIEKYFNGERKGIRTLYLSKTESAIVDAAKDLHQRIARKANAERAQLNQELRELLVAYETLPVSVDTYVAMLKEYRASLRASMPSETHSSQKLRALFIEINNKLGWIRSELRELGENDWTVMECQGAKVIGARGQEKYTYLWTLTDEDGNKGFLYNESLCPEIHSAQALNIQKSTLQEASTSLLQNWNSMSEAELVRASRELLTGYNEFMISATSAGLDRISGALYNDKSYITKVSEGELVVAKALLGLEYEKQLTLQTASLNSADFDKLMQEANSAWSGREELWERGDTNNWDRLDIARMVYNQEAKTRECMAEYNWSWQMSYIAAKAAILDNFITTEYRALANKLDSGKLSSSEERYYRITLQTKVNQAADQIRIAVMTYFGSDGNFDTIITALNYHLTSTLADEQFQKIWSAKGILDGDPGWVKTWWRSCGAFETMAFMWISEGDGSGRSIYEAMADTATDLTRQKVDSAARLYIFAKEAARQDMGLTEYLIKNLHDFDNRMSTREYLSVASGDLFRAIIAFDDKASGFVAIDVVSRSFGFQKDLSGLAYGGGFDRGLADKVGHFIFECLLIEAGIGALGALSKAGKLGVWMQRTLRAGGSLDKAIKASTGIRRFGLVLFQQIARVSRGMTGANFAGRSFRLMSEAQAGMYSMKVMLKTATWIGAIGVGINQVVAGTRGADTDTGIVDPFGNKVIVSTRRFLTAQEATNAFVEGFKFGAKYWLVFFCAVTPEAYGISSFSKLGQILVNPGSLMPGRLGGLLGHGIKLTQFMIASQLGQGAAGLVCDGINAISPGTISGKARDRIVEIAGVLSLLFVPSADATMIDYSLRINAMKDSPAKDKLVIEMQLYQKEAQYRAMRGKNYYEDYSSNRPKAAVDLAHEIQSLRRAQNLMNNVEAQVLLSEVRSLNTELQNSELTQKQRTSITKQIRDISGRLSKIEAKGDIVSDTMHRTAGPKALGAEARLRNLKVVLEQSFRNFNARSTKHVRFWEMVEDIAFRISGFGDKMGYMKLSSMSNAVARDAASRILSQSTAITKLGQRYISRSTLSQEAGAIGHLRSLYPDRPAFVSRHEVLKSAIRLEPVLARGEATSSSRVASQTVQAIDNAYAQLGTSLKAAGLDATYFVPASADLASYINSAVAGVSGVSDFATTDYAKDLQHVTIGAMLGGLPTFDDNLAFLTGVPTADRLQALTSEYMRQVNEYQANLNAEANPQGIASLYQNTLTLSYVLSGIAQTYTGLDMDLSPVDIRENMLNMHSMTRERLLDLDISVDIDRAKSFMPAFRKAFSTPEVQTAIKAAAETTNLSHVLDAVTAVPEVREALGVEAPEQLTASQTLAYLIVAFENIADGYDPGKAEAQNELIPLLVEGKTGLVMTAGGKTIATIFRELVSIAQSKRFGDKTSGALTSAETPAAAAKFDIGDTDLKIKGTNVDLTHQHLAQLMGSEVIDITKLQETRDVDGLKNAFRKAQEGALLVIDQTQLHFLNLTIRGDSELFDLMANLSDMQIEEIDSQAVNRNQYINADTRNGTQVDDSLITSTTDVVNEILNLRKGIVDMNGEKAELIIADNLEEFTRLSSEGKYVCFRHGEGLKARALYSKAVEKYVFYKFSSDSTPNRTATIINTAFDTYMREWRLEYTARRNEVKPCEEGQVSETDFQGPIERIAYSVLANHYLEQEKTDGIITEEQYEQQVVNLEEFLKVPTLEEATSLDIYWRMNQKFFRESVEVELSELKDGESKTSFVSGAKVMVELTEQDGNPAIEIISSRGRVIKPLSEMQENFTEVLPNVEAKMMGDKIVLKKKLNISGSSATHQLLVEDIFGTPVELLTPAVFNPSEFTMVDDIDSDFVRNAKKRNTDPSVRHDYTTLLSRKDDSASTVRRITENMLASHQGAVRGVLGYIHDYGIFKGVLTALKEQGFKVEEISRELDTVETEIKERELRRAEISEKLEKKPSEELQGQHQHAEEELDALKKKRDAIIADEAKRLASIQSRDALFVIDANTPQELINVIANNAGKIGAAVLTFNAKTQIGVDYRSHFDRHDYGASEEDLRKLLQGKGRIGRSSGDFANNYMYLLQEDIDDSLDEIRVNAAQFRTKMSLLKSKVDGQSNEFGAAASREYANNIEDTSALLDRFIKGGSNALTAEEKFQLNAYYRYFTDTSESALHKIEESIRGYWQARIKDAIDALPEKSGLRTKIEKIYQNALDREHEITPEELFAEKGLQMLTPEERVQKVFDAELSRGMMFMEEVNKALSRIADRRHSSVRVARKYAKHTQDEIEQILNRVRSGSVLKDKAVMTPEDTSPLASCLSLEDIYNTSIARFLRYVMPGKEVDNLSASARRIVQQSASIKTGQDLRKQMREDGLTQQAQDELIDTMRETGWIDEMSDAVTSLNAFKAYELFKQLRAVKSEVDILALRRVYDYIRPEGSKEIGSTTGPL